MKTLNLKVPSLIERGHWSFSFVVTGLDLKQKDSQIERGTALSALSMVKPLITDPRIDSNHTRVRLIFRFNRSHNCATGTILGYRDRHTTANIYIHMNARYSK